MRCILRYVRRIEGITIGIKQFRDARKLWLHKMLLQPFRGAAGGYAITSRSEA